jgi:hypothetical protein
MVAVYDKALKRQDLTQVLQTSLTSKRCDFTGVVDAEAKAEAKATKDAKAAKKDGKTGDGRQDEEDLGPKSGAQLGKITNLMHVTFFSEGVLTTHSSLQVCRCEHGEF